MSYLISNSRIYNLRLLLLQNQKPSCFEQTLRAIYGKLFVALDV